MDRKHGSRRRFRAPYAFVALGSIFVLVAAAVLATGGAAAAHEKSKGSLLGLSIHLDWFGKSGDDRPPGQLEGCFTPKPPPYVKKKDDDNDGNKGEISDATTADSERVGDGDNDGDDMSMCCESDSSRGDISDATTANSDRVGGDDNSGDDNSMCCTSDSSKGTVGDGDHDGDDTSMCCDSTTSGEKADAAANSHSKVGDGDNDGDDSSCTTLDSTMPPHITHHRHGDWWEL